MKSGMMVGIFPEKKEQCTEGKYEGREVITAEMYEDYHSLQECVRYDQNSDTEPRAFIEHFVSIPGYAPGIMLDGFCNEEFLVSDQPFPFNATASVLARQPIYGNVCFTLTDMRNGEVVPMTMEDCNHIIAWLRGIQQEHAEAILNLKEEYDPNFGGHKPEPKFEMESFDSIDDWLREAEE